MYKETFFVSHDGYWNARDLDGRISTKIIIVYFTLVTSSTTSDRYEDNKTKARFLLRISAVANAIDQFRYIKIQSNTIDLRTRLWGINPTNSVVIPQSLVLRSIVWGWILRYRKLSIETIDNGWFASLSFVWIALNTAEMRRMNRP